MWTVSLGFSFFENVSLDRWICWEVGLCFFTSFSVVDLTGLKLYKRLVPLVVVVFIVFVVVVEGWVKTYGFEGGYGSEGKNLFLKFSKTIITTVILSRVFLIIELLRMLSTA
jgi:hypothetical protein